MASQVANAVRTSTTVSRHSTVASIRAMRKSLDRTAKVGFVPTMGALHEGTPVNLEDSMKWFILSLKVFMFC